jgi:hypothetical protein
MRLNLTRECFGRDSRKDRRFNRRDGVLRIMQLGLLWTRRSIIFVTAPDPSLKRSDPVCQKLYQSAVAKLQPTGGVPVGLCRRNSSRLCPHHQVVSVLATPCGTLGPLEVARARHEHHVAVERILRPALLV